MRNVLIMIKTSGLKTDILLGSTFPMYVLSGNEKFLCLSNFLLTFQLPYLIDGNTKITQSNAILRYIGRKHKMCGDTEEEKVRVDILESQAMDFRMQLVRVCHDPNFPLTLSPQENLRLIYLQQLPKTLQLFSHFLGTRRWFAGKKMTFVDFSMYDILDLNCKFLPTCLDPFPNLQEFLTRFEGLKKISAYMNSPRYLPKPVFLKMAKWGTQ
ncbi:glutathione S-transferase Mu 7-like isoform X3 [Sminthopsis crassicaudata]|uniref:glutathione S-transferase Mu 7-like isoform X3 n=1 Tax=Sminthopsis crassicaudata TaxID=9301 RepID=UPI003D681B25